MKLIPLFFLCLASLAFVATIAFAIARMPVCTIGCGCSIALFLLIASREADAAEHDREWSDSTRHPRL